jgi:N utilization substance protein B
MSEVRETGRPRRAVGRSTARLAAVQALFQIDTRGIDAPSVVEEFRRHRLSDADTEEGQPDLSRADAKHFAALVLGAALRANEVDALIDAVLPVDWPRARLDPVVRATLRAGCFELLARDDVPVRVAIDEYVAIARAFFDGAEPGFVNGVLDALARRIRPDAFILGERGVGGGADEPDATTGTAAGEGARDEGASDEAGGAGPG